MSEITYYVALPFVQSDDGIAPGGAGRVLQSERGRYASGGAIQERGLRRSGRLQPDRGSRDRRFRGRKGHPEIRQSAGRFERAVKLDHVRNETARMR
jgi:hypothetical protein